MRQTLLWLSLLIRPRKMAVGCDNYDLHFRLQYGFSQFISSEKINLTIKPGNRSCRFSGWQWYVIFELATNLLVWYLLYLRTLLASKPVNISSVVKTFTQPKPMFRGLLLSYSRVMMSSIEWERDREQVRVRYWLSSLFCKSEPRER